ncbi:MAG: NAD(P)/FAD-dependent oxidoreductase [Candidatus Heimdallarchaeum endolithica]|uniref:Ferredoxin--NADP reductase n=1 Tax=Candidatus Heimdallarchaeum endolithica TaxID=2876572 RepID=A0A9Y1BQN2_9ARCH|nr:MAG: NAD(P)/FAD-dependent oxidoreductase [Candidatus Heimdallarchaeum endolithica]
MTTEENDYYADVGIIGGGVGGLGAAIIAAYKGLKVTVFESGKYGGIVSTLYSRKIVENYPGAPSILGKRLIDEFVIQAQEVQAELKHERVIEVLPDKTVVTNEGKYRFRVIIIATGSQPAELGIPGERKFKRKDKGVYNFVTDPELFKRKKVVVVGGGDTAIDSVWELRDVAEKVYLVHRRDSFRAAESKVKKVVSLKNVEIVYNSEIEELKGEQILEKAVLLDRNTKLKREIDVDACILAVGMKTNIEIFDKLELQKDGKYIKVDKEMRTNIPGVFAIGDVATAYQLIVIAVAQGAIAAHNAFGMIRKPYWYKDVEWPTEIE